MVDGVGGGREETDVSGNGQYGKVKQGNKLKRTNLRGS